jgi:5-hydroxyisourate hydrolase
MSGLPASNLKLELFAFKNDKMKLLGQFTTNDDGRVDTPLLQGDSFTLGHYQLEFHAGDYLQHHRGSDFLDIIPIRFHISDASRHYHVPLLLSAYGYSTYRGS